MSEMGFRIRELRLGNGLLVLAVERRGHPVVSSMIWYGVGSRDERTGETGLSHFLEHMMFKGTRGLAKGRSTSSPRASAARTTPSPTTTTPLTTSTSRAIVGKRRSRSRPERVRGCRLDSQEFVREKKVVLEEMRMGDDDPWRDLAEAVGSAAFHVHPYHHPVIGWKADLDALSRERMADYYRAHYAPSGRSWSWRATWIPRMCSRRRAGTLPRFARRHGAPRGARGAGAARRAADPDRARHGNPPPDGGVPRRGVRRRRRPRARSRGGGARDRAREPPPPKVGEGAAPRDPRIRGERGAARARALLVLGRGARGDRRGGGRARSSPSSKSWHRTGSTRASCARAAPDRRGAGDGARVGLRPRRPRRANGDPWGLALRGAILGKASHGHDGAGAPRRRRGSSTRGTGPSAGRRPEPNNRRAGPRGAARARSAGSPRADSHQYAIPPSAAARRGPRRAAPIPSGGPRQRAHDRRHVQSRGPHGRGHRLCRHCVGLRARGTGGDRAPHGLAPRGGLDAIHRRRDRGHGRGARRNSSSRARAASTPAASPTDCQQSSRSRRASCANPTFRRKPSRACETRS